MCDVTLGIDANYDDAGGRPGDGGDAGGRDFGNGRRVRRVAHRRPNRVR